MADAWGGSWGTAWNGHWVAGDEIIPAAVLVSPLQRPRTNDWKEIEKFYQALVQRFSYWEYSVTPVGSVTPRFVGDRCLETTNDVWYFAVGTTSADWVEI